jgi:DNA-binding CsgD family transcriptional regulator
LDQRESTSIEDCPVCNRPFDSHDNLNSPCIDKILAIYVSGLCDSLKVTSSSEDIARIQEAVSINITETCAMLNSTQITLSSSTNSGINKDTLKTEIKDAVRVWNSRRKLIGALKKQSFENNDLKFFHLFHEAVAEQRFWRQYLRRRFRFDVKRFRWLRNPPPSFGIIERNVWTYARNRYLIFHSRLYRGTRAFAATVLQGKSVEDAYTQAILAMEAALYEAFYAIAVAAVAIPWRDQQDTFLPKLSGYVKAQIKQFPRLKKAFGNDPSFEQLPGAVFLALQGRPSEEFPPITGSGSLVNAVVKLLETEASRDQEEIESSAQIQEIVAQEFETFILQEEARLELSNLKNKAGLSGRETQVLELKLQDYTEEGIASRLGITEGAVKSLWSRTRSKFKKAAEK